MLRFGFWQLKSPVIRAYLITQATITNKLDLQQSGHIQLVVKLRYVQHIYTAVPSQWPCHGDPLNALKANYSAARKEETYL